jgi:putative aldouronate transport system permease protein
VAVGYWNSYFAAMIYLPNPKLQPIQLYLMKVLTQSSNQLMNRMGGVTGEQSLYSTQVKYACIIVVILPILFVYPFLQKYFVKGVMIGAIKE